jgi:hypothetical protein
VSTALAHRRSGKGGSATRLVASGLALMALCTPAFAAECPLERAIYGQDDSSTEIWFSPLPAGANDKQANRFEMRIADFKPALAGSVDWTLDFDRPNATLSVACPEVPAGGGGCTLWQGVIYAIGEDGTVRFLPEGQDVAPASILFSDLGRAIIEANGVTGAFRTVEPVWDGFSLKGCSP